MSSVSFASSPCALAAAAKSLRRLQRRGDLARALPAQLGGLGADHVLAHAVLHFVQLRHVRDPSSPTRVMNTGPRGERDRLR